MWEVVFYVRKWDVGKGEDRTQHVGFSQSIKEVWKGQGSMGGSVLQEKGGLGEGIVGKTTILAPGDNVDTGRKSDTISIGTKLSNSSSIIISHKGHFGGKTSVFTG